MLRAIVIGLCTLAIAAAAELPVKKVVLYKHGVAYFERSGELGAGETARLDFKASEMNDVLKSLTLTTSSGKVVALRYDASEPTAEKLANYPLRLKDNRPLSSLLDQLKGERVALNFGKETVSGVIVGARLQPAAGEQAERQWITLLLGTGDLVTRDLSAASSIRFPDPRLERQLQDYLKVLSQGRSRERRSVYIDSTGSGRRQIRVAYMIPAPVWKSSYRLIFPEHGEPTLEGWAIVDNTTGEDWNNVELALVSGHPISFISKLYQPRYVKRPVAELPEQGPRAPVLYQAGMGGGVIGGVVGGAPGSVSSGRQQRKRIGGNIRRLAAKEMAGAPPAPSKAAPKWFSSTMAAPAQGRELGELFEYRFQQPVTIRRNESAMLGFLQQKIDARRLLIYSDRNSLHPMNAAELTNSTGKTLDGGPITVFEAGAYAGEALMETLKAGDKRFISYGVDLGTRITTAFGSSRSRTREVHLRHGVLTAKSAIRETRTYTIHNVDQKPKTLIIEYPVRPGYRLLNQKPSEKTASAYRFEIKLAAGATEKFPVTEERVLTNTYALANQTPELLASFVENKELDQQARRQLERIAAQKRKIAGADATTRNIENQVRELTSDQDRIRKNIVTLNRVSGQQEQVQKYAAELGEQETRLAGLRDRLSQARKQKNALQAALNQMIESMEF